MNTHSPLIPQGTLPVARGKSHIRIAIITILAVHVVLLLALLMAGCKKEQLAKTETPDPAPTPFDPTVLPVSTNPPTPPTTNPTATAYVPSTPVTPLPTTPVTPAILTTFDGTDHTVMKGDNFSTLSTRYHVSTKAIAAANPGVDSTKLKIGQKLKIPTSSPTPATPAGFANSGTLPSSSSDKVYTVKSGDNLNKIAKLNETSVKALRAANNLKTDRITVGQKLKIPSKTSESTASPAVPSAAGGTGTNL